MRGLHAFQQGSPHSRTAKRRSAAAGRQKETAPGHQASLAAAGGTASPCSIFRRHVGLAWRVPGTVTSGHGVLS